MVIESQLAVNTPLARLLEGPAVGSSEGLSVMRCVRIVSAPMEALRVRQACVEPLEKVL